MQSDTLISERILEDMTSGVMTISRDGQITTFNPAASAILGIPVAEALNRSFAELFLAQDGNDDFNQTILDAVYEDSVKHCKVVPYHLSDGEVILSLSTSLLRDENNAGEPVGIIAVFTDITEVQALRETEERLTSELKNKHRELQDAYLRTEESNRNLHTALKKVQVIRITATAFTFLLFVGVGLFSWHLVPGKAPAVPLTASGSAENVEYALAPQTLSASISLTGRFQPLEMVTVAAPLSGKVLQSHVRYGELVHAGQTLITMDPRETLIKLREARSANIKARASLRQLEAWDKSGEMARAHRSLAKAKMALENQKKTLEESERLFKKGIIPATEYESAKHQFANQTLDYQTAEEEVRATGDKGNSEQISIARHEVQNSEARLKQIETELAAATVTAPVAGIIMKPATSGGTGKDGKPLERGVSFQQGEALLSIGNLAGFTIESKVDEIDVTKIRIGQPVRITGDVFPGVRLDGRILALSPNADTGEPGGAPSFGVTVVVDNLSQELRSRIFVGMTANLEIVILDKKDALVVPLPAVRSEGGKRYVMVKTAGGPARKTQVTTGTTTQDAVELLSGVKAGDIIELAGQPPQKGIPASVKR